MASGLNRSKSDTVAALGETDSFSVEEMHRTLSELQTKEPEWKVQMHAARTESLKAGNQLFTETGLTRILSEHAVACETVIDQPKELKICSFGLDVQVQPRSKKINFGPDATCMICFDGPQKKTLINPCEMAGIDCKGCFCVPCYQEFLRSRCENSRYSVGVIPCPCCRRRLHTETWGAIAEPEVYQMYQDSAQALMSIRCPSCHTPHSLCVNNNVVIAETGEQRDMLIESVFGTLSEEEEKAVMDAWVSYFSGKVSAEEFLNMLIIILLSAWENVQVATQVVNTKGHWESYLCHERIVPLFQVVRGDRCNSHGVLTKEEDGNPIECNGVQILRLISDVERRVGLQLAFLRRFPFIHDSGCSCHIPMCFKCKVKDFHAGQTCEQRQRQEMAIDVQYCPACGVPTIRTEGCRSMICVCGAYWEWRPSEEEMERERQYDPCWGANTWVLTPGGGAKRIKNVRVGDLVRTVRGFKAVAAVWTENLRSFRNNAEVGRFRGVWITSHHPVLLGRNWYFPANVVPCVPAAQLAHVLGVQMYNLELEGHEDTVVLAGDGPVPSWPLTVSCTIGKFLGAQYGVTVWTRRSTRCNVACQQCDAVYSPGINFSAVPHHIRWQRYPMFPQVEYPDDDSGSVDFSPEQAKAIFDEINQSKVISKEHGHVYNVGLVMGKFMPLHRGHQLLLTEAQRHCKNLVVMVGDRRGDSISPQLRQQWVKEIVPFATVLIAVDDLPPDNALWARRTMEMLGGRAPDVVFTGPEEYGPLYAKEMGCAHKEIQYWSMQQDATEKFSASEFRENPFGCWDALSAPCRAYFSKRICVLGVESSGTTTLARALANHYCTVWAPEYGRMYWEGRQYSRDSSNWDSSEFVAIAAAQQSLMEQLSFRANKFVIADTDALATHIWHRRYTGRWDAQVEEIADRRPCDLYLLTIPDFPFVQDGTRDGEHIRTEMHDWFEQALVKKNVPFIKVGGSHESRMHEAIRFIDEHFQPPTVTCLPPPPFPEE